MTDLPRAAGRRIPVGNTEEHLCSEALADVERRWNEASQPWDPDALAANYGTNALFFGGLPGHELGVDEIRKYFATYVGNIASASLHFHEQQYLRLSPDCFLAQGYGDFVFVLTDGTSPHLRMRTTLVVQRANNTWKIVLHHFSSMPESAPV